jgi:hypothetical protein
MHTRGATLSVSMRADVCFACTHAEQSSAEAHTRRVCVHLRNSHKYAKKAHDCLVP